MILLYELRKAYGTIEKFVILRGVSNDIVRSTC